VNSRKSFLSAGTEFHTVNVARQSQMLAHPSSDSAPLKALELIAPPGSEHSEDNHD